MNSTSVTTRTAMSSADLASGRNRSPPRASMANEWIKLRTIRSTARILGLTAAVAALVVGGFAAAAPDVAPDIAEGLALRVVF